MVPGAARAPALPPPPVTSRVVTALASSRPRRVRTARPPLPFDQAVEVRMVREGVRRYAGRGPQAEGQPLELTLSSVSTSSPAIGERPASTAVT